MCVYCGEVQEACNKRTVEMNLEGDLQQADEGEKAS
jgi:hypothetical protein